MANKSYLQKVQAKLKRAYVAPREFKEIQEEHFTKSAQVGQRVAFNYMAEKDLEESKKETKRLAEELAVLSKEYEAAIRAENLKKGKEALSTPITETTT